MDSYTRDMIKNWSIGIVFGLFTVLLIVLPLQLVMVSRGTVTETLPVTPDDFTPTIRLVVFGDSHNENDNVADIIDTSYALFDEDSVYAGVDGFFYVGDFSSVGSEGDYERFVATLAEHVRAETPAVSILGNHEFKNSEYYDYFVKHFGYEPDTVTEINGFSCIAFSGEASLTEWTFTPSSLKWLDKAVSEAEEKNDGRAIFVFQHPHVWGTVYGSTVWGDPQLNLVFNKHPGIVDLSGHSHFPLNDPRSILQTKYTTVGTGVSSAFELDKNFIPGQHPDGFEDASEMVVLEADNDGSLRVRGYDTLSDRFFCDYYIDNVYDRAGYAYTYRNMKAHDAAPVFDEDTQFRAYKNESGEWVISFDEAKAPEGYIVHDYTVTIKDGIKTVLRDTFIDDYFVYDDDDTADFRIGADTLESGKTYTVSIKAASAYHKLSKTIKLEFTAE